MASERRTIRRKLGILALIALAEVVFLFIWLPVLVAAPLALAGLWAVDHYFISWMDLALRREGHAARGAEEEETVGSVLNRLPAQCVVLHDVAADFGNIDHVVFRKDGVVFVTQTKAHGGRVTEERAGLLLNGRPFVIVGASLLTILVLALTRGLFLCFPSLKGPILVKERKSSSGQAAIFTWLSGKKTRMYGFQFPRALRG